MKVIKFGASVCALAASLSIAAPAAAQSSLPLSSTSSLSSSASLSSHPSGPERSYPDVTPDATRQIHVTTADGQNRDYLLSVPEDYDPSRAYPVWFAFPGWKIAPEGMTGDTGLRTASEALIVYGRGVDGAWAGAPYATATVEQDIAYVRAIVEQLAGSYSVDTDRIYAIGHSNGGGMAMNLACRASDLVAGVVGVAGAYYDPVNTGCASTPVPVMVIHSTDDVLMNYRGGERHDAPYLGARELAERYAQRNNCSGITRSGFVTGEVTRDSGVDCDEPVELITSRGDGHNWPHYTAFEAWDFLSVQSQ